MAHIKFSQVGITPEQQRRLQEIEAGLPEQFHQQPGTRDLTLQEGTPASFLDLGRRQSGEIGDVTTQFQNLGFALLEVLKRKQELQRQKEKQFKEAEITGMEREARFTLQRAEPGLSGAEQQRIFGAGLTTEEARTQGAKDIYKAFIDKLGEFDTEFERAQEISKFIVGIEKERKEASWNMITKFPEAVKNLSEPDKRSLEKDTGLPKGFIDQISAEEVGVQTTVDLGDRVAVLDKRGNVIREIAKGVEPGGKPPTATQESLAVYASRIEQANPTIQSLENTISKMSTIFFNAQLKLPPRLQSNDMQRYMQAGRNFINSVLRRESGAVIAESEFVEARQQYLPQPGDSSQVLADKRKNREIVFRRFVSGSGSAYQPLSELLGEEPLGGEVIERGGTSWRKNPDGTYTRIR